MQFGTPYRSGLYDDRVLMLNRPHSLLVKINFVSILALCVRIDKKAKKETFSLLIIQ